MKGCSKAFVEVGLNPLYGTNDRDMRHALQR